MTSGYRDLLQGMWLAWAAYWWVSSCKVKPAVRRESLSSRLSHGLPLALAALCLLARIAPIPALQDRVLPATPGLSVLAAVLTAAGLLFSVWARWSLGANWSASVTIKDRHELVTNGPYGVVRHPIYTGMLLALLGSALAVGEWRAVFALALAALALGRKRRLEERWMLQQFGEAYRTYARTVPALIPFLRGP